ncbi:hypothetical protein U063_1184 [Helicobacter pylori BM012A]|uniref:Uncharacterized protein n=1 Tax=Helicobacter pylori BM012S TaxID=1407463 RepID=V5NNY7_HELPX|nr:hypothetical protein U063_1184 [Helicobacter pylori BM012A]AHA90099.1 hypothetical protein U064_1188 [Helicobacter pylori BM012S]
MILNPLKKAFLSSIEQSIEQSVEEWQNKVKELLDENKSDLAEMNEINEQLPQAQKNSKNSQTKKPLCSRLNLENL